MFIKKCFLFMVGSVCRVKRFTTGSRNSVKDVRKSQMMPDKVRKWPRQQSKDFNTAGFEALVKRWDKCISAGGGYVEKSMLLPGSNIICFTFHIHCDLFRDPHSHHSVHSYQSLISSSEG
jgi:hypothetical protein